MIDIQLLGLLNATLQAATLLFVAALGELITEKSGILTRPNSIWINFNDTWFSSFVLNWKKLCWKKTRYKARKFVFY